MTRDFWKGGWQEGSFERIRNFVGSSPAWFRDISPADAVEDSYLLTVASTLFLREEEAAVPPRSPATAPETGPPSGAPLGVPPFAYERCLAAGATASETFAACTSGTCGAFHRHAAGVAGSAESWSAALAALRRAGALRPEWPVPRRTHLPPPSTFSEDLRACNRAVLGKAIHAFKIGFGLWGRWESA